MAYEQKNNSGAIFKNKDRKEEKHPNLTGSATIDGKQYWVSAWTNTDKNGDKYISFTVKEKEQKQ